MNNEHLVSSLQCSKFSSYFYNARKLGSGLGVVCFTSYWGYFMIAVCRINIASHFFDAHIELQFMLPLHRYSQTSILIVFLLIFIGIQASQEVYVPRVSTLITAVTSDGLTKITKRLIWVHVGRPIHSVVLHMPKELFLKKCKWTQSIRTAKQNANESVTTLTERMCSKRVVEEMTKCDADNDDKDDDAVK